MTTLPDSKVTKIGENCRFSYSATTRSGSRIMGGFKHAHTLAQAISLTYDREVEPKEVFIYEKLEGLGSRLVYRRGEDGQGYYVSYDNSTGQRVMVKCPDPPESVVAQNGSNKDQTPASAQAVNEPKKPEAFEYVTFAEAVPPEKAEAN